MEYKYNKRAWPLSLACLAAMASLALAACNKPPPDDHAVASAAPASSASSDAGPFAHLVEGDPEAGSAAKAIAASGDEATRRAAGPRLVAVARWISSPAWRAQKTEPLKAANSATHVDPTPAQFESQLSAYQAAELVGLLGYMAAIGGPEIVAYCFELAESETTALGTRRAALAALQRAVPASDAEATARRDALATRLAAAASAAAPSGPPGSVSIGGVSLSGGRVANASAVVAGMAAGFRRCLRKARDGAPDPSKVAGTVRMKASIGANGEVVTATATAGSGLPPELISCMSARVSSAQFAPPEGGGSATLEIPVTLQ